MTVIKSKDLQIYNAKKFKKSVGGGSDAANLYFTFGRCYPWDTDANPPLANTSVLSTYTIWDNLIGGKKLTGNNLRHVIPRFNWTSGASYIAYDDAIDSKDLMNANTQFYVVTDDWNVYKCLSNNYGAVSTSKPISISAISDFQTADGYIWKYMYTISSEERMRYVTEDYIPIRTVEADDKSLQWQVQQNAIPGALHNIVLLDRGNEYFVDDVYVTIQGDGQDANAFVTRDNDTGRLTSVVIDNKGFNYTFANVTISSATGTGAIGRAVISPPGGHGSDALSELGGSSIMINLTLKNFESDKLPVDNEYRQIGLIENPHVWKTSTPISNTVVSQTTQIELNGLSNEYAVDEYVYQGPNLREYTFKGRVVDWDSANNLIKLSNVTGDARPELLIGESSGAARFLASVTHPDMQPYTGKILYIDNIQPIERAADQAEDFKIVLNF